MPTLPSSTHLSMIVTGRYLAQDGIDLFQAWNIKFFLFFISQFGKECWCGHSDVFEYYEKHGPGTCHMRCAGDRSEPCGEFFFRRCGSFWAPDVVDPLRATCITNSYYPFNSHARWMVLLEPVSVQRVQPWTCSIHFWFICRVWFWA